jgi:NAD(P)-dependent dehydrogenase (short-subunit alcohol dehydrogenase family)
MLTNQTVGVAIEAETATSKIAELDSRTVVVIGGSTALGHRFAREISGTLGRDFAALRGDALAEAITAAYSDARRAMMLMAATEAPRVLGEHFRWSRTFEAKDEAAARTRAKELFDSMYRRAGAVTFRVFREIEAR